MQLRIDILMKWKHANVSIKKTTQKSGASVSISESQLDFNDILKKKRHE